MNREFAELMLEYCNKWVSESGVTEPGIPSILTVRSCQHLADVKDLLGHYIDFTDNGN